MKKPPWCQGGFYRQKIPISSLAGNIRDLRGGCFFHHQLDGLVHQRFAGKLTAGADHPTIVGEQVEGDLPVARLLAFILFFRGSVVLNGCDADLAALLAAIALSAQHDFTVGLDKRVLESSILVSVNHEFDHNWDLIFVQPPVHDG